VITIFLLHILFYFIFGYLNLFISNIIRYKDLIVGESGDFRF
jgi:hypothetical protein